MTADLVPYAAPSIAMDTISAMPNYMELALKIARTDFVPKALRGNDAAVLACMLTGLEVGVGPMQSLAKIHVIEGRPAISAELMRAIVLREGHKIWIEDFTQTKVTVCGRRADDTEVTRVSWTLDDAKRAKLAHKPNWQTYPRAMLAARATGELCRLIFADVLGGISYTPEELEDLSDSVTVDEAPAPPPEKTTRTTQKRRASKPDEPAPDTKNDTDVAQRIAMRCRQAGIDRARLASAVSYGRTESTKELSAAEAAEALNGVERLIEGSAELIEKDGHWWIVAREDGVVDVESEVVEDQAAEEAPTDDDEPTEDGYRIPAGFSSAGKLLSDLSTTVVRAHAQRVIADDTPNREEAERLKAAAGLELARRES